MFPGAREGPVEEAAYGLVGAPLERSASFYPGARFGPERIRHFARGFEDFHHRTEQSFTELGVVDRGEVRPWQDPAEYLDFLAGEVGDLVRAGAIPLLLGGEHTVSVAGVRASDPDVYVCVDAHLDLRESFDGDRWSHATTVHHVLDHVDEAIVIGVRAASEGEWARATATEAVTVVSPSAADDWIAGELPGRLDGRDAYLSIDVDGFDPAHAPATGTREPFGLDATTGRRLVETTAPHAVGFDLVEVTDRDEGETATLAGKLLREFVFTHAHHSCT